MQNGKTTRTAATVRAKLGYLSDREVAAFLGVKLPTFRNRRSRGDAPPSSKIGAEHVTLIPDLHAYVARKRTTA